MKFYLYICLPISLFFLLYLDQKSWHSFWLLQQKQTVLTSAVVDWIASSKTGDVHVYLLPSFVNGIVLEVSQDASLQSCQMGPNIKDLPSLEEEGKSEINKHTEEMCLLQWRQRLEQRIYKPGKTKGWQPESE